jgi:oligopeptide transport system substrate-binding protein
MRLPTEPPTLDWNLATDNISKEIIQQIQEGLVDHDSEGRVRPHFAKSWTLSTDQKTYTFKLRDDLKWTDGSPLTAGQFVDSWERLLNSKTASEYAYFLFDIVGAEAYQNGQLKDFKQVGIRALDSLTFQVELKNPVAYWIHIPTFWVTYPIRKDLIAQFGDQWTRPEHIVSVGSYTLKEQVRDSKIRVAQNPLYPADLRTSQSPLAIEYRIIREDSTAVSLFQSGDLEVVRNLPPLQLPALAKRDDFLSTPWFRGFYIGFNIKDPQVADVRVRRALALAIDRNELAQIQAISPSLNITSSWIPKGMIGFSGDALQNTQNEAKKLWDSLPQKPQKLELWYDQQEFNKIIMENIQAQWKRVLGLDVQLTNQEWKVYLKTLKNQAPAVFRMGWGADYPDPDTFMSLFTCVSGNNFTRFCDAEYDRLVRQGGAGTGSNQTQREALYLKASLKLLNENVVIIPLFTVRNLHLVSKRLSGFHPNPMGDFSFRETTLK